MTVPHSAARLSRDPARGRRNVCPDRPSLYHLPPSESLVGPPAALKKPGKQGEFVFLEPRAVRTPGPSLSKQAWRTMLQTPK